MEKSKLVHIFSVYGRTVSIIGNSNKLKLAVDAICAISSGGMHGAVYDKLESANRRNKNKKKNAIVGKIKMSSIKGKNFNQNIS